MERTADRMTLTTAKLVELTTLAMAYGGLATLIVSAFFDQRWIASWAILLGLSVAAFGLRSLSITLGKYSYVSPSAIAALSGALLVGPVTTALALSIGIAVADRVVYHKSAWAVLVNLGREVLALYTAFGFYAATMVAGRATAPVSAEGVPALFIFAVSYFVYWRWLFYFSLLARGKLGPEDRQLLIRYEVIVGAILTLATAAVVFSVLALPVAGWVFMSALMVAGGMLVRRMLEETIRAEELNKLHAMDAVVSGAFSLHDSLAQIEQLAHRILDWGDFRVFRLDGPDGRAKLVYRGVIGRRGREEPPVEFEELRHTVVTSGIPIVIHQSATDERTATLPDHIASSVVYPVRLGENVIGTLELEHHKAGTYRRQLMPLLDACAHRVATAVHIADLRRPLSDTVRSIGTEVRNLRAVVELLQASAGEAQSASHSINVNLTNQEREVSRGLEEAERLTAEGRVVADGGASAATASAEARHVADQSRAMMGGTIEKLSSVKTLVGDCAEELDRVRDLLRSIATRIGVIREQADLTQLIALNAGIESARTDNGGRGLGVVADEIRQLADDSGGAAAEVVGLIGELRESLGGVLDRLRRGSVVVTGAESLGASGLESLDTIVTVTRGATSEARRIALSAEGQRSALHGLRGRMANVAALAAQNRRAAQQLIEQGELAANRLTAVTEAIDHLNAIASMLAELTERFTFERST